MDILSWNVQGAFPKYTPIERIDDQISYISDRADSPDILTLNEVNRYRNDKWLRDLEEIGYTEIEHTLDWAEELGESDIPPHQDYSHVNGNLTAVHEDASVQDLTTERASIREGPWEDADLKDWDTNCPEKILKTSVKTDDFTLSLWNIRAVPGSMHGEEKVKILDNVYNRILKEDETPCILTGDFNCPQDELADGRIIPWRNNDDGPVAQLWQKAETNIFTGLSEVGMRDVFRDKHGFGDLDILDVSHATQTDDPLAVPPEEVEGKRFDHMLASESLVIEECHYDQQGYACSDHAPLITDFRI